MAISVSDLVSPSGAQDIPVAPAPAAPQPGALQEPLTPKDESKAQIPDSVLQILAFSSLLQGSPPAVIVTQQEFDADPSLAVIQQNIEPLLYSGFGVYQPKSGGAAVFYNGQFIDGNTLKIADEKGKLDAVATPYSELKSFFDANIGEAAAAPAPVASSPAMGAPASASSQTQLANARIKNLAVGSPTSGPVPGQGRVLNNILKSTV